MIQVKKYIALGLLGICFGVYAENSSKSGSDFRGINELTCFGSKQVKRVSEPILWYPSYSGAVLNNRQMQQELTPRQQQDFGAIKKTNTLTVALDGSGDFTKIQDAINASPSFPYEKVTVLVKNGVYNEKVRIPQWNTHLALIGESKEKTIISFDDNFSKINLGRNSTFYTATVSVEADDFSASNLTIKNTSGDHGQAIALSVVANRVQISNCNILGNQDSLYLSGNDAKQYFKNCYIEGTTDFIFGGATALFENCEIHSIKSSYITAASTPQGSAFGFVFKNCKLTAAPSATAVYLGRPWRIYAKTVYIHCDMGKQIRPEGWENWSKPEAEKNTLYAEYNCTGEGFQPTKRVSWSQQLQKKDAEKYTIENILKDSITNWYSK